MAGRDFTLNQFSMERARKTLNVHLTFNASAVLVVDGQGSKGILSVSKVTTPAQAGTFTISFGNTGNFTVVDTYVKSLVIDNIVELEYSASAVPSTIATPVVWRDDINNAVPQPFGDVAPVQSAIVLAGGGAFVAGTYKWLVAAVDSNGNETQLATMLPQEQTATPAANQQATIAWATVVGASSYDVYRTAAAGISGSENVFVGNTTGLSLVDPGTAGAANYQGGLFAAVPGAKLPNFKLPAFNFARPAYGYGALTVAFYNSTPALVNPNAGEGIKLQIELGDSGT